MREHGRTFSSVVIREDIFLKAIECRRATPARDLRSISERGVRVVKTHDARRASHRFGRLRFRRARRERLKEELVCVCVSVLRANSSLAFSRSWNGIECNSSKVRHAQSAAGITVQKIEDRRSIVGARAIAQPGGPRIHARCKSCEHLSIEVPKKCLIQVRQIRK